MNMNVITNIEDIGVIPVETELITIFDRIVMGKHDDKGDYYLVLSSDGKYYAITPEGYNNFVENNGRKLMYGETEIFNGILMRGKTEEKEMDMDIATDIWGNVPVKEGDEVYAYN